MEGRWALLLLLLGVAFGAEERAHTVECPAGFVGLLPRGKCYLTTSPTERYSFTDCQAQVRPFPKYSEPDPRSRHARPGLGTQIKGLSGR